MWFWIWIVFFLPAPNLWHYYFQSVLKGKWNVGGRIARSFWFSMNAFQQTMFAIGVESNKHHKFNYESVGIFDCKHLRNLIENIHCTMALWTMDTHINNTQTQVHHWHVRLYFTISFGILVVGVLFLAIRHSTLTSLIIKLHMKVKSK